MNLSQALSPTYHIKTFQTLVLDENRIAFNYWPSKLHKPSRNESQVLNVWYLISYTEKSNSSQEVKDMLPKRSVEKHHALYQYGPSNNIMNFALKANFLWLKYSTLEWRKNWDPLYPTSLDFTILHSICKKVFIFIFNMYN